MRCRVFDGLSIRVDLAMEGTRGTYRLERKIATGGMATVWEASDLSTDQRVAIKALHPHLVDDDVARRRFVFEAETMMSLHHPNLVRVFDIVEDADGPFMVMELLEGHDLARLMRDRGRFDPDEATRIVRAAAAGVAYAHQHGILHRDIKPANIVLDGYRVVVVDFGIASTSDPEHRLTSEQSVVGTLPYLAPERAIGHAGAETADVYALGMVLYELVTGTAPFSGKTPEEIVVAQHLADPEPPSFVVPVPRTLEQIILRCLLLAPNERYRSAVDLLEALEAHERGDLLLDTAMLERPRKRFRLRRRRRTRVPGPAYAAAASVATLAATWAFGL